MSEEARHAQSFSLSARIRLAREERGMKQADLAREARLDPERIAALERGDFPVFSAHVYARGFLKKIAAAVALEKKEEEEWQTLLTAEWNARMGVVREPPLVKTSGKTVRRSYVMQKRTALFGAGIAGLLFLSLVGFQLVQFFDAPRLVVREPEDGLGVVERVIAVRGEAEKESRLTVNGQEIRINESGLFDETVALFPGVNELTFRLEDRFGKETRAVRYVVVK